MISLISNQLNRSMVNYFTGMPPSHLLDTILPVGQSLSQVIIQSDRESRGVDLVRQGNIFELALVEALDHQHGVEGSGVLEELRFEADAIRCGEGGVGTARPQSLRVFAWAPAL